MSDSHRVPPPEGGSLGQPCAPASRDGFRSSGQSPGIAGDARSGPATATASLHLVGPGQVGRAFLRQLGERPVRVVAVSDSTATAFDRGGLPIDALVRHKAEGRPLSEWPGAERIPAELAIRLVGADFVVDATPSSAATVDEAVARGQAALQSGAHLVLCSKSALSVAAPRWLGPGTRRRVGVHAVLGGAGAWLVRELDLLRQRCDAVALVGNVTTTAIVTAVERGASVDEGIAAARDSGFLEPDPTLDLDGTDAATKLLAVWAAVFGETWSRPPALDAVRRQDVRSLDPTLLQQRAARGATTRLVARGDRAGRELRVAFEEVPVGSPLAAPPDRVVYGFVLPEGLRVFTGLGVGYERTAEALWFDVDAALAEVVR